MPIANEPKYSREIATYFKDISKIKVLTVKEENALVKRIQEGDDSAVNTLVKHNLKFVVNVAKTFRNPHIPFADLISEGNLGLIYAARKFDISRGTKFITYAVFWIRSFILKHIRESSEIIDDEVSDTMISAYHQRAGIEPDNVESELFEAPPRDETVNELLECLQEREKHILEMFYGLDGGDGMTLDEISLKFNISQERVRQIKDTAISKLKCEALMMDETKFEAIAERNLS